VTLLEDANCTAELDVSGSTTPREGRDDPNEGIFTNVIAEADHSPDLQLSAGAPQFGVSLVGTVDMVHSGDATLYIDNNVNAKIVADPNDTYAIGGQAELRLKTAGTTLTVEKQGEGSVEIGALAVGGAGGSSNLKVTGNTNDANDLVVELVADASNWQGTLILDQVSGETLKVKLATAGGLGDGSLAGEGTVEIQGGAGTLNLKGSVSPGSSSGTLAITGNVDLNAGATYNFDLDGGGADALNISGSLSASGAWTLVVGDPCGILAAGQVVASASGGINANVVANATITGDVGAPQIGDTAASGDAVVSLVDLNNVLNTFGQTGPPTPDGDTVGSGDDIVSLADLNNVLNHFGESSSGSMALEIQGSNLVLVAAGGAVPEPATLTLLAVGGLALIRRRRR